MNYMSSSKVKFHYYAVLVDCFNNRHRIKFSSASLYSVQEVFDFCIKEIDLYFIYQVDPGIIRSFVYKFSEYE